MSRRTVPLVHRLSAITPSTIGLTALVLAAGLTPPCAAAEDGRTAPLLEGMGENHFPITTAEPMAQRYFDQGLVLAYGFNHAEAERSFLEAARRDPACAICYWGAALVLGPNLNAAMEDEAVPRAWEHLGRAVALQHHAGEKERALIRALAARYAAEPAEDRSALDEAYAAAMARVVRRFPQDADIRALYAEALMDLHPWDFWERSGEARPWTPRILEVLEGIFEDAPGHPGANHFYIHAVEASQQPGRAEAAADRLGALAPGAGHLVHMPAHIYQRVGRYRDASEANERAILADDGYVTQCHAQGLYPVAYMPHNHHFLWASATMEGRAERALSAARHIAAHVDPELMRQPGLGTLQHFYATPNYAMVRFRLWDELLAEAEPVADLVYPRGVWHYARGMAQAGKGRFEAARQELAALRTLADDPALEGVTIWDINTSQALLEIAEQALAGEIAARSGDLETAIGFLEEAVRLEDGLNYDEPSAWHSPMRQSLGAVLLEAGRAEQAEAVYRQDLANHAENGWSLHGLADSLRAQRKNAEAAAVQARFEKAWARADVELNGSRF